LDDLDERAHVIGTVSGKLRHGPGKDHRTEDMGHRLEKFGFLIHPIQG
jgi:hypothetical protein